MKKIYVLIPIILLLVWFFLDMIGISFENSYLVSRSFSDDGIFFIIYLISVLMFIFKEKKGKYLLTVWLGIWLFVQVLFHYGYKLIGQSTESKINYFDGSIKIINTVGYFPDLYHFVLHILILISLSTMIIYIIKNKKYIKS